MKMKTQTLSKAASFGFFASALLISSAFPASLQAKVLLPSDLGFIIGGSEVAAGDVVATTTVALRGRDSEGKFLCSGSLIAEDLVVTAGHCLGDAGNAQMTVVFRRALTGEGSEIQATGTMRPDEYDGNPNTSAGMYDIALVHFAGGLPPGYRVASVMQDPQGIKDGEKVTLAGYGLTQANPPSGSGTLRKVDVTVSDAQYTDSEVLLDESHGRGSCNGDSGGAAFVTRGGNLVLFGITSRGDQSCSSEGIYTNIAAHAGWIEQASRSLRNGS